MITKYSDKYYKQLELVIMILPEIAKEECFCIKGGTAINLFYANMPRISVDIDLVYLPLNDRTTAIQEIEKALLRIKSNIESLYDDTKVSTHHTHKEKILSKLYVSYEKTDIVIEPNLVLRGSLFPSEKMSLVNNAVEFLKASISDAPVLSRAEVYAGKICAALDRQHPRDLFDIKILYENGGITNKMRQAFVVYLASSPRPISEMLNPNLLEIEPVFSNEFSGMTTQAVTLEELLDVRQQLISDIRKTLTDSEKDFLISIKMGTPQWELLPFENLSQLPALRWKLINIQRMNDTKRKSALNKLNDALISV